MKISEAFREAQKKLWDGSGSLGEDKELYSCGTFSFFRFHHLFWMSVHASSYGCEVNAENQFDEFPFGEERQGARFMWLEMLALIAEDEGL